MFYFLSMWDFAGPSCPSDAADWTPKDVQAVLDGFQNCVIKPLEEGDVVPPPPPKEDDALDYDEYHDDPDEDHESHADKDPDEEGHIDKDPTEEGHANKDP